MKNYWVTLVFGLIVVAVAYYSFTDLKKSKTEQVEKAQSIRVFSKMSLNEVTEVKINKGTEEIILKKQDKSWQLLEPVNDKASDNEVETYIRGLLSKKFKSVLKEQVDWVKYGLDKPSTKISITKGSEVIEVSLSSKEAFNGNLYLRKNKESELLVGEDSWQNATNKTDLSFRDHHIVPQRFSISEVQIKKGPQQFGFIKKENWQYSDSSKVRVEKSKVDVLLDAIKDFKVKNFIEAKPQDIGQSKYKNTYITLNLKNPKGEPVDVYLTQPYKGQVFVYTSERNYIFSMDKTHIKDINFNKSYYKDLSYPFKFDLHLGQKIEVDISGKKLIFSKKDKQWIVDNLPDGKELDTAKVDSFLQQMADLQAKKIGPQKADKDSKEFNHKVKVYGLEDQLILDMAWGGALALKQGKETLKLYKAYTNKTDQILGVLDIHLKALEVLNFFKNKPQNKNKNGN